MSASHSAPEFKSEAIQRLCSLYQRDSSAELNQWAAKIGLKDDSVVWKQIADALEYRTAHYEKAKAAIDDLNKFDNATNALANNMHALQGRFIAMFAAQRIPSAVYHFYGHGKEMSQDPGNFASNILMPNTNLHKLLRETVNALGAAHDIVQGKGPYINEKESADVFTAETQKAIDKLLQEEKFTPAEVKAISQFRDHAIPFLAQEGIINATYLLFGLGKRDFDNILNQVDSICVSARVQPVPKLDKVIAGMKMAIALSDTRRSEMTDVLNKRELLLSIPEDHFPGLEKLLKAAQVLQPKDKLRKIIRSDDPDNRQKASVIEGFLLRIGQNIRMTAEIAAMKNDSRQKLISKIRQNAPAEVKLDEHVTPFIASIEGTFGESAFARDLGIINKNEILQQAEAAGLSSIVNTKTLDLSGWERHANNLSQLKTHFLQAPPEDQQAMANALYFCAAKPPGHKVGETYKAMVAYEAELKKTHPQSEQLTNLTDAIREVEAANPHINKFTVSPNSNKRYLTTNHNHRASQVEPAHVEESKQLRSQAEEIKHEIRVNGPRK